MSLLFTTLDLSQKAEKRLSLLFNMLSTLVITFLSRSKCLQTFVGKVMSLLFNMFSAAAKSLQSCLTVCNPINGSPPGSPIPGILQARHWSGLPFPSPVHERKSESEVFQSCLTPSDPMDCSLPGSFVHGIFQARVLE